MGIFQPNTLEIQAKESQRCDALNFRWESISSPTAKGKGEDVDDGKEKKPTPNFQVCNYFLN
jgi:hypothetical protein